MSSQSLTDWLKRNEAVYEETHPAYSSDGGIVCNSQQDRFPLWTLKIDFLRTDFSKRLPSRGNVENFVKDRLHEIKVAARSTVEGSNHVGMSPPDLDEETAAPNYEFRYPHMEFTEMRNYNLQFPAALLERIRGKDAEEQIISCLEDIKGAATYLAQQRKRIINWGGSAGSFAEEASGLVDRGGIGRSAIHRAAERIRQLFDFGL